MTQAEVEEKLNQHSRMRVGHELASARHEEALTRLEAIVAKAELANEQAREEFKAEDKRLLTAQILMNGAMAKMATAMEETTEKLNALIRTVDGVIRKPSSEGTSPAT